MKHNLLWLFLMCSLLLSCKDDSATGIRVERMGSNTAQLFNDGWLFKRYGFQPDGTRIEEPDNLEDPTLNDSDWKRLTLPHDWAIEGPFRIELAGETGKLPYKAIGWYRKHFKLENEDACKRIYIDFDGAMAYAEVWLNGQYVGGWPYGYNSFRLDLTPYAKFDTENILAVKLNTEKFDARWYSGGGIYRNVWLVKNEPIHIAHWGTFITTPNVSPQSASVNIKVELENHTAEDVQAQIITDIYELDSLDRIGKKATSFNNIWTCIKAGQNTTATINGYIDHPKYWDIQTPNRYIAVNKVIVDSQTMDTYNTSFGIRTIEFTPKNGFLLNGKRVDIKGTCNHHDLGALGSALTSVH